jgi:hypothetical protein
MSLNFFAVRTRNVLAASVAVSCVAAAPPNPFKFDQTPYVHAQRLVSIGDGRRLNIYCTGAGSPTVILDLGFGARRDEAESAVAALEAHGQPHSLCRAYETASKLGVGSSSARLATELGATLAVVEHNVR